MQGYCHTRAILNLIPPAETHPTEALAITQAFSQPQCPRVEQWYSHARRRPRVSRTDWSQSVQFWLEVLGSFHRIAWINVLEASRFQMPIVSDRAPTESSSSCYLSWKRNSLGGEEYGES